MLVKISTLFFRSHVKDEIYPAFLKSAVVPFRAVYFGNKKHLRLQAVVGTELMIIRLL